MLKYIWVAYLAVSPFTTEIPQKEEKIIKQYAILNENKVIVPKATENTIKNKRKRF